VELVDVGEFRPTGEGESWTLGKGERRWRGAPGEVVPLLDECADGERLLILERCGIDLPIASPVLTCQLRVWQEGKLTHDQPIRVHRGQRPVLVLREGAMPTIDLPALIAGGYLPNYDTSRAISSTDITAMLAAKATSTWQQRNDGDVSERWGYAWKSWTGGIPLSTGTEPSTIPIWELMPLYTGREDLWRMCEATRFASGNFLIHFTVNGRMARPAESRTLPNFLEVDQAPFPLRAETAAGVPFPIPDAPHLHSLAFVRALLTGRRYFVEELEAWALFCILSQAEEREERVAGIGFSGQIRQFACFLRALLQLILATRGADDAGAARETRRHWTWVLLQNLEYATRLCALPDGKQYNPMGVMDWSPLRRDKETGRPAAAMGQWMADSVQEQAAAWNYSVLAHVLGEIRFAGFEEAEPLLRHALLVVEGLHRYAPTPWDRPWGNVARADSWQESMRLTFANRAVAPTAYVPPIDSGWKAWHRAGLVPACDLRMAWAREGLDFMDMPRTGQKPVPLPWATMPRLTP
jgi:hypothetical protein